MGALLWKCHPTSHCAEESADTSDNAGDTGGLDAASWLGSLAAANVVEGAAEVAGRFIRAAAWCRIPFCLLAAADGVLGWRVVVVVVLVELLLSLLPGLMLSVVLPCAGALLPALPGLLSPVPTPPPSPLLLLPATPVAGGVEAAAVEVAAAELLAAVNSSEAEWMDWGSPRRWNLLLLLPQGLLGRTSGSKQRQWDSKHTGRKTCISNTVPPDLCTCLLCSTHGKALPCCLCQLGLHALSQEMVCRPPTTETCHAQGSTAGQATTTADHQ